MHVLFFDKSQEQPELFAGLDRDGSLYEELKESSTYLGRIEIPENQVFGKMLGMIEVGGNLETGFLALAAEIFEMARLSGSRSI
tara:strand:+ start:9348 stop:9599 length:252 start_codon:yes stop_codon:yes gene_type:complete